jgi:hypothetical protein
MERQNTSVDKIEVLVKSLRSTVNVREVSPLPALPLQAVLLPEQPILQAPKVDYNYDDEVATMCNYSKTSRAFNRKQLKVNLSKTLITPKEVIHERNFGIESLGCLSTYIDSGWDPVAKDEYVNVLKLICLREDKLYELRSAVKTCNEAYWKYAEPIVNKKEDIDEVAFQHTCKNLENLVVKAQSWVCSAIRSYRNETFKLLDAIMTWRNSTSILSRHQKPHVMYKNQSYITKMTHDVNDVIEPSIVRIWLGFSPTYLFLPPSQYNPLECWKGQYWSKMTSWLEFRRYFNTMHVQRPDIVASTSQADVLARRSSGVGSKSIRAIAHGIASSKRKSVTNIIIGVMAEQSEAKTIKSFTWREMMSECKNAWDISNSDPNSFWANHHHKTEMVEAAIGLQSVFPSALLGTVVGTVLCTHTVYSICSICVVVVCVGYTVTL